MLKYPASSAARSQGPSLLELSHKVTRGLRLADQFLTGAVRPFPRCHVSIRASRLEFAALVGALLSVTIIRVGIPIYLSHVHSWICRCMCSIATLVLLLRTGSVI